MRAWQCPRSAVFVEASVTCATYAYSSAGNNARVSSWAAMIHTYIVDIQCRMSTCWQADLMQACIIWRCMLLMIEWLAATSSISKFVRVTASMHRDLIPQVCAVKTCNTWTQLAVLSGDNCHHHMLQQMRSWVHNTLMRTALPNCKAQLLQLAGMIATISGIVTNNLKGITTWPLHVGMSPLQEIDPQDAKATMQTTALMQTT